MTGSIDKLVGANVCALRREQGLSAAECASALRIEATLYRAYEAGLHRFSPGHLMTLAERLHVPLSAFYAGSDMDTCGTQDGDAGTLQPRRREKA